MSKARTERLDYLRKYYGRGGWHGARMVDVAKKYQVMQDRLLKDGHLEKDPDYDLYRMTEAEAAALSEES